MAERIVKAGIIGLGARAETLLATMLEMNEVQITSICDFAEEKIRLGHDFMDKYESKDKHRWSDMI